MRQRGGYCRKADRYHAFTRNCTLPALSQGVDFHERNAMGNTWDFETPEKERDFESYFNGKCKFQLWELLTKYGDIGVIWFDVPWGITSQRAKELRRYVQEPQPGCLINGRLGGDTSDSDFLYMGDYEVTVRTCIGLCGNGSDYK